MIKCYIIIVNIKLNTIYLITQGVYVSLSYMFNSGLINSLLMTYLFGEEVTCILTIFSPKDFYGVTDLSCIS